MMLVQNLMIAERNLMMKILIARLPTATCLYMYIMRMRVIICSQICRICPFLARFSHFLGPGVTLYVWREKSRLKRKFVQSLHRWFNLH